MTKKPKKKYVAPKVTKHGKLIGMAAPSPPPVGA